MEPGGYLDLTDSRIQDGTKAVFAQNGISESFLNLTGNIFCNNETGIYLNSITTSTLLTTNIANNEIYAPSLKGSGTKGDFGIYINEVKIHLQELMQFVSEHLYPIQDLLPIIIFMM